MTMPAPNTFVIMFGAAGDGKPPMHKERHVKY